MIDPAERARLEDERDFLLRSLDDLDVEHAAGDVDDADHLMLRADYSRRAAVVLRALDPTTARPASLPGPVEESPVAAGSSPSADIVPERRSRVAWWIGGVAVLAVLVGLVLAQAVGSRAGSTSLTGSGGSEAEQLRDCLSASFQDPPGGIRCYDRFLADSPDNVEALTYRGWARIRTGEVEAGSADVNRAREIDPTFPDAVVFAAVVAKDAGDFAGAQNLLDELAALNPPAALVQTMDQMGLSTEVAFGLLDPEVQACWMAAQTFYREAATSSTTVAVGQSPAGFDERLACFDAVLVTRPDLVDALTTRAAFIYQMRARDRAPSALADLERALVVAPGDPSALLLRSVLRLATGDTVGAIDDLAALQESGGRPSALFQGEANELQAALAALQSGGSTTTVPQ